MKGCTEGEPKYQWWLPNTSGGYQRTCTFGEEKGESATQGWF